MNGNAKSADGEQLRTASPVKKKKPGQGFYRKIVQTTKRFSNRNNRDFEDALSTPSLRIVDIDEISIPAIQPTRRSLRMMVGGVTNFLGGGTNATTNENGTVVPDALAVNEEGKIKLSTILGEGNPQEYLDDELRSRGYSTKRYKSLESAYYNSNGPSPLQLSSYGVRLLEMIDHNDEEGLESCLLAGIHSNPCNEYNQSILHRVCNLGNVALLDVMLENSDGYKIVQIADDFGRTPLHEACSSPKEPSFTVIETLLMHDAHLFYMADAGGNLPLELVEPEYWYDYLQFLQNHIDRYWPSLVRSTARRRPVTSPETEPTLVPEVLSPPPPLALEKPGSRVPCEPVQPLTVELAWMVSSGVIEPEEAISYLDPEIMQKFLPTIQKRLNQMALEEEMKERVHNQIKQHDYVDYDNNNSKDDLTV